jgi:hypothetical protein
MHGNRLNIIQISFLYLSMVDIKVQCYYCFPLSEMELNQHRSILTPILGLKSIKYNLWKLKRSPTNMDVLSIYLVFFLNLIFYINILLYYSILVYM